MSTSDFVNHFPTELSQQVFELLDLSDIKSSRLVTKAWHDVSSQYLMTRIFFALRRNTLDVFDAIADHPILSQHITTIVYDISLFTDLHDFSFCAQRNQEHYRRPRSWQWGPPSLGGRDLRYCTTHERTTKDFGEYRRLLREQEKLKSSGEADESLRYAATRLKKVNTVFCADWRSINGANLDRDTGTPRYASWYVCKGPMKWDISKACFPSTFEALADISKWPHPLINWEALLEFPNIQRIKIELGDNLGNYDPVTQLRPMQIMPDLSLWPSCTSGKYANFMDKLTRVWFDAGCQSPRGIDTSFVFPCLENAKNLRTLRLKSTRNGFPKLKHLYWPKLEKFSIRGTGWAMKTADLMDFLTRHALTLRMIHLDNIGIHKDEEDSWTDVLDKMRHSLKNLVKVGFVWLHEHGDYKNVINAELMHFDSRLRDKWKADHRKFLQQWVLGAPPRGQAMRLEEECDIFRMEWDAKHGLN